MNTWQKIFMYTCPSPIDDGIYIHATIYPYNVRLLYTIYLYSAGAKRDRERPAPQALPVPGGPFAGSSERSGVSMRLKTRLRTAFHALFPTLHLAPDIKDGYIILNKKHTARRIDLRGAEHQGLDCC